MRVSHAVLLSSILTTGACLDKFPAPPSETRERDAGVISDGSFLDDQGTRDALVTVIDAMLSDTSVPLPQVDAATPVPDAGQVLDAAQLDATIPAQDAAPVPDSQSTADAAAPMIDAATPDAAGSDAQATIDSATPDAATDAAAPMIDAAESDFGSIIPDATPDAEIPSDISIRATRVNSPSGQIDCYDQGRLVRVRAESIVAAAGNGQEVSLVCLLAQAGVSITLEAQINGRNCAGEIIDGPLCTPEASIEGGCLTIGGLVVTQGDNLRTIQMNSHQPYEISYGPNSDAGHTVKITAHCN